MSGPTRTNQILPHGLVHHHLYLHNHHHQLQHCHHLHHLRCEVGGQTRGQFATARGSLTCNWNPAVRSSAGTNNTTRHQKYHHPHHRCHLYILYQSHLTQWSVCLIRPIHPLINSLWCHNCFWRVIPSFFLDKSCLPIPHWVLFRLPGTRWRGWSWERQLLSLFHQNIRVNFKEELCCDILVASLPTIMELVERIGLKLWVVKHWWLCRSVRLL